MVLLQLVGTSDSDAPGPEEKLFPSIRNSVHLYFKQSFQRSQEEICFSQIVLLSKLHILTSRVSGTRVTRVPMLTTVSSRSPGPKPTMSTGVDVCATSSVGSTWHRCGWVLAQSRPKDELTDEFHCIDRRAD